jgi:hypothetical protein
MPTRAPEFVEQLGRAYALGTAARPLATLFGITPSELVDIARRQGWQTRAEGLWAPGKTARERAAEIRAAEAARQVELYGCAGGVDDVRTLRRRGFTVTREGNRYRVGNALCSLAELRAKAARERRLMQADRSKAGAGAHTSSQSEAASAAGRGLRHL